MTSPRFLIEQRDAANAWLWEEVAEAASPKRALGRCDELADAEGIDLARLRVRAVSWGGRENTYRADLYYYCDGWKLLHDTREEK